MKGGGATSVPNGKGIHDSDLLNLYIRITLKKVIDTPFPLGKISELCL